MASWVDFLVPFGTAAGGAASVWGLVVVPRQRLHEQHEAQREREHAARIAALDGVAEIPGVVDGVAPLAVRVQAVEKGLKKNTDAVTLMAKRMDEANGTAKRTEEKVTEILKRAK